MGIFGTVVLPRSTKLVAIGQTQIPGRITIRSQLVGDKSVGPHALVHRPSGMQEPLRGQAMNPALGDGSLQL